MPLHVAGEMHRAALPGAAEHLGDSFLQAHMSIRDTQKHPGKAPGDERAQELAPEGLALGLAHIGAEDFPASALVHPVGHHQGLPADAARFSHLLHPGVQPQIRIAAL